MYTQIKYNGHIVNLIKGAFEVIIDKCNSYYDKNGIKHIFSNRNMLSRKINSLSSNKLRIIALAINEDRQTLNNMTLLTEIRYTKFISTKINVLGNR
jgi:magnesium-transporting ATPase (P-type)